MPSIADLWLPIVLGAIALFLVSWILHVFVPHHRSDYIGVPNEDAALAALRGLNIPPGNYMLPHGGSMKAMSDPAFLARLKQGPVAILRLGPGMAPGMGRMLLQWFVFLLAVGIATAYLASRTLPMGSDYLSVFRVAGTVTFLTLGGAHLTESIWYMRRWRTAVNYLVDALIYGLIAGGIFGWLWPAALPPA